MDKLLILTLQSGQSIELTPEDIRNFKPQIDKAFENLDSLDNFQFRNLPKQEIEKKLEEMTFGELYQFAKENEEFMTFKHYQADQVTRQIWKELCKRKGLGWKQLLRLSKIQTEYLESLGLVVKAWKQKDDL